MSNPHSFEFFIVFQAENSIMNTEGQRKAADEKGKNFINLIQRLNIVDQNEKDRSWISSNVYLNLPFFLMFLTNEHG